jgi:hypothetical protein
VFLSSAVDTREGNVLLKNYYGMQDGAFPAPTVSRAHTFQFDFRVSALSRPALRLEWIDYPGGWWGHAPQDVEEQQRQLACMQDLLDAQVGFLLIDGSQYRQEGSAYLRGLLSRFAHEVGRWQRSLVPVQGTGAPHLTVIEEWVIALAKADLFPANYTAEDFGRAVIKEAVEELNELATALYGQPQQFGTRFMLVSAAQGDEVSPQRVRSVERTIGLELIAPAALILHLDQMGTERGSFNPRADLPWWQRLLLTLEDLTREGSLDHLVGRRYKPLLGLLQALGSVVRFDVEQRAEELRAQRDHAVREGDALKATALVMQQQLASPAARRAYFVSQA